MKKQEEDDPKQLEDITIAVDPQVKMLLESVPLDAKEQRGELTFISEGCIPGPI